MDKKSEPLTLSPGIKFLPSGRDMNSDSTQPRMESRKGEEMSRSGMGLRALGVLAKRDE